MICMQCLLSGVEYPLASHPGLLLKVSYEVYSFYIMRLYLLETSGSRYIQKEIRELSPRILLSVHIDYQSFVYVP